MTADAPSRLHVFMAEDNPGDVTLMLAAMEEVGLDADLEVSTDGAAAIARLLDLARPLPDLIILNFNLPKLLGYEVLQRIKATERLCAIPAVMLTTSTAQRERLLCERADAYFVKSADWDGLVQVTAHLRDFLHASPSKRLTTRRRWADDHVWQRGDLGNNGPRMTDASRPPPTNERTEPPRDKQ